MKTQQTTCFRCLLLSVVFFIVLAGDWCEVGHAVERPSWDVDGNGHAIALGDGLIIQRFLQGMTGLSLVAGVVDLNGTRTTPEDIIAYLEPLRTTMLDVDCNGEADAGTDGMMILLFLFGIRGESLIDGFVNSTGCRTNAVTIERFLSSFLPDAKPVIDFLGLPDRIETNLQTFIVPGEAPLGSEVRINGREVPLDDEGNFVFLVPLTIGENIIELLIDSEEDEVTSVSKMVIRNPNLSTAGRRLLYVDAVPDRPEDFSPGLDGTIVLDVDSNLILGIIEGQHVRDISPDGQQIYIENRSVFSTATHQELGAPASPLNFSEDLLVNGFLVSPNGSVLYAGDEILDLQTNTLLPGRLPVSLLTGSVFSDANVPGGPTISIDGKRIFAGPPVRRECTSLIETDTLILTSTICLGFHDFLSDLGVSPDGKFLLRTTYCCAGGKVDLFDAETFELLKSIGLGDFTGEIAFSADGQKAIVGNAGNPSINRRGGGVSVIDLPSLEQDSRVLIDLADNLTVSAQDEVFVSSGNRLGIDVFLVDDGGILSRSKSFFLGINRFRASSFTGPKNDEIRKIVLKQSARMTLNQQAVSSAPSINQESNELRNKKKQKRRKAKKRQHRRRTSNLR